MIGKCLGIILLVFSLSTSIAKDLDGEFVIFTVGGNDCSGYLAARQNNNIDAYRHWLSGYLTAFNLIITDTYDIVGDREYGHLIAWLDHYCSTHTQESFANAVAVLTTDLYPQRQNRGPGTEAHTRWVENGPGDGFTRQK